MITLAIFVGVFLAFLLAPMILLGVAFLAYLIMRPRADKTRATGPAQATGVASHGFGSGTQ